MGQNTSIIDAARLTVSLLEDLKSGGADNPELDILRHALAAHDTQYTDPDARRARRGQALADLYATFVGDDDPAAAVSDLIAELGHACDAGGISFLERVRIGIRCWLAETEIPGDPDQTDVLRSVIIEVTPPRDDVPAAEDRP